MPPTPREPCHCPRCKGALVSRLTVTRHAAASRKTIPTFDEWMAAQRQPAAREHSADELSDGANGSENEDASGFKRDDQVRKRPRMDNSHNTDNPNDSSADHRRLNSPVPYEHNHGEQSNNLSPRRQDEWHNPLQEDEVDEEDEPQDAELQHEQQTDMETEARTQLARTPTPDPVNTDPNEEEDEELPANSRIEDVRITQEFIAEIGRATYYNGKLEDSTIDQLENPLEGLVDISDPDTRLSLDIFMACSNASEETYNNVRQSILTRFPDTEVLSYHLVKKLVADITGVCAISDDMCINSCHAFTGPFKDLDHCRLCNEPRFDPVELARSGKNIPRQQACTIPLGPQLQALRRSREGAEAMRYRDKKTTEIQP